MARADLAQHLYHYFGGVNPEGDRFAEINNSHVVHETGYEVKFGRHSLAYFNGKQSVSVDVDYGDDGLLIIFGSNMSAGIKSQVVSALEFLNVKYVFE